MRALRPGMQPLAETGSPHVAGMPRQQCARQASELVAPPCTPASRALPPSEFPQGEWPGFESILYSNPPVLLT